MTESSESTSQSQARTQLPSTQANRMTPELVRQVADKVFAMLVEELRIERERLRYSPQQGRRPLGGGR